LEGAEKSTFALSQPSQDSLLQEVLEHFLSSAIFFPSFCYPYSMIYLDNFIISLSPLFIREKATFLL
jgi:hypothetical protein